MIDGHNLAQTAKHTPELIDPDQVRQAGRQLETFSHLLAGMDSWYRVDDQHIYTFTVSHETHLELMWLLYGE